MVIKSNIDGFDVILEGEALASFLAQKEKDAAELTAQAQAKAEAEAKRAAILERLGLTEEEAKLLLG